LNSSPGKCHSIDGAISHHAGGQAHGRIQPAGGSTLGCAAGDEDDVLGLQSYVRGFGGQNLLELNGNLFLALGRLADDL
jgi:hypothetical protein